MSLLIINLIIFSGLTLYHIVFLTNNEEIYDACMLLADFIYVRREADLHI